MYRSGMLFMVSVFLIALGCGIDTRKPGAR